MYQNTSPKKPKNKTKQKKSPKQKEKKEIYKPDLKLELCADHYLLPICWIVPSHSGYFSYT